MFGYHHSCVSVGLAHQGRIIAGFVYNPYVDEMYKGIRGQGSWLNGQKLEMEIFLLGKGLWLSDAQDIMRTERTAFSVQ